MHLVWRVISLYHPRYDPTCVWWDVKPCSIYHYTCNSDQARSVKIYWNFAKMCPGSLLGCICRHPHYQLYTTAIECCNIAMLFD